MLTFTCSSIVCLLATTRSLYENKLRKLLQSNAHDRLNEAEKNVLYSDSEEEEEGMTRNAVYFLFIYFYQLLVINDVKICRIFVTSAGPDEAKEETFEQSDEVHQDSGQVRKL